MIILTNIHNIIYSLFINFKWNNSSLKKTMKAEMFNSILALRSTGKDNSCRHFSVTYTTSTQSAPFSLAQIPGGLLLLTSVNKMLCRYPMQRLLWPGTLSCQNPIECFWECEEEHLHCPPIQVVWLSGNYSTPHSLSPSLAQILPESGMTPLLLHMIQYFCVQRSKNCPEFYCSKGPQKERSKLET